MQQSRLTVKEYFTFHAPQKIWLDPLSASRQTVHQSVDFSLPQSNVETLPVKASGTTL